MGKNKQQLPSKKPEAQVPAYLVQEEALGVDNIGMEDVIIPRLKIVQGQTRAKANNRELRDGDWYHSVKETSFGPKMNLFCILKWNSRIIFDDNLKFVASEFTDYKTKEKIAVGEVVDDNDPRWKDCINYFVVEQQALIEGIKAGVVPEVLIYTAMSASLKAAKKLNSFFRAGGQRKISMFAHKIEASTEMDSFDKGNAYMPIFTPKGFASEKEYEGLRALYDICSELASTEAAQRETEETTEETEEQGTDTPFDSED